MLKKRILLGIIFVCAVFQIHTEQSYIPEQFILPEGINMFVARSLDGAVIEIHDGAQFLVTSGDIDEVMSWEANSPLLIAPNPYWFFDTDFFITNQRTGAYVSVHIIAEPNIKNYLTRTIYHIDPFYGEVVIEDGKGTQSCFEVEPKDLEKISRWRKGQTIIVGINDNWLSKFFSEREFILINFSTFEDGKYVRASGKPL